MSTPVTATPTESRPSPSLTLALSLSLVLGRLAVQWETQGAEMRNQERRVTVLESEFARVSSTQSAAATQSARLGARIDARFDAMSADIAWLTRAVERLTDARALTARELR